MLELIFVRHGQPAWSPGDKADDEPGLTALGHQEAEHVATRFANTHFDGFYVSPLRRARETAAPLARALNVEPTVIPWFEEFQAKKMMGWPSTKVDEYFLHWRRVSLLERFSGPVDGESLSSLVSRVSCGMQTVLRDHGISFDMQGRFRRWTSERRDLRLLFVGHSYATGTVLNFLLGLDATPYGGEALRMGWGAVSRVIDFEMAGGFIWRLRDIDDRSHLLDLPHDDE